MYVCAYLLFRKHIYRMIRDEIRSYKDQTAVDNNPYASGRQQADDSVAILQHCEYNGQGKEHNAIAFHIM